MVPAATAVLLLVAQPLRPAALGVAPRRAGLAPRREELAPRRDELAPRREELAPRRDSLAPQRSKLRRYRAQDNEKFDIGSTNRVGVTKYGAAKIRSVKSKSGAWWPNPGGRTSSMEGAQDLSENVSWGWHHPNGVYATIPVGAPLIDASSNIYLASDDAVRKFSASGDLEWSYAPRGQIAAAPSLMEATTTRRAKPGRTASPENALVSDGLVISDDGAAAPNQRSRPHEAVQGAEAEEDELMRDSEAEEQLAPSWTREEGASYIQLSRGAGVGGGARARAGVGQHGEAEADARRSSTLLVGSTTAGYVFAIDIDSGDEVWATQASEEITGVKGMVAGYGGMVFVATNRCTDRYCYRYRSVTNPLTRGNSLVRALSAFDGTPIWSFRTKSPLWNFVPQFSNDGNAVMFNDYEGAVYSLDVQTGALQWRAEGAMGTHTESSCVYSSELNQVFQLGMHFYEGEWCNPYVPRGIQPACGTQIDWPGWVRGLNASSGKMQWQTDLPQPPASAAVGYLNTPKYHTRLVVSMGFNCHYGATSALWTISPESGHPRVKMDGPTLWGTMCAGDKEAGDIRRAMTGRAYCEPGSWSSPVIDGNGDIFIGNQVGELQRLGADSPTATGSKQFKLLSTLSTEVAFQDQAIAIGPNIMAVATCTSLIVFQTYLSNDTFGINGTWEFMPGEQNYPVWEDDGDAR